MLYFALGTAAGGTAWMYKGTSHGLVGVLLVSLLISLGTVLGAYLGTPAGQEPTVKQVAMSAFFTGMFILICSVMALMLRR